MAELKLKKKKKCKCQNDSLLQPNENANINRHQIGTCCNVNRYGLYYPENVHILN